MLLGVFEIDCAFHVLLGVQSISVKPVGVKTCGFEPRWVLDKLKLERFASGNVFGDLAHELLAVEEQVDGDVRALSHVWRKVFVFCLIFIEALENELYGTAVFEKQPG